MNHLFTSGVVCVLCVCTATVQAQVQDSSGATGGSDESTGARSTTESIGRTTEGIETGLDSDGGEAGSNVTDTFIGGGDGGFVGGAQERQNQAVNRFFRAITGEDVPTGGSRGSSGEPRRIPVRLKLGFLRPTPRQTLAIGGRAGLDLTRFVRMRPGLQAVGATMDDQGQVTLTGVTPDDASRRLAVNLLRLQPGVRSIRNEIALQGPAPTAQ